jgi:5-methylcytosine-specific restriction enzyme A
MSTRRGAKPMGWPKRQEDGHYHCRWCNQPLTGNKQYYCSPECKERYYVSRNFDVRRFVARRDNEICAVCGLDCAALVDALNALAASHSWYGGVFKDFKRGIGIPRTEHVWEADHIVPVVEGGGECDLSNFRTLCVWCHRKETAALAARRAERRRAMPLFKEAKC